MYYKFSEGTGSLLQDYSYVQTENYIPVETQLTEEEMKGMSWDTSYGDSGAYCESEEFITPEGTQCQQTINTLKLMENKTSFLETTRTPLEFQDTFTMALWVNLSPLLITSSAHTILEKVDHIKLSISSQSNTHFSLTFTCYDTSTSTWSTRAISTGEMIGFNEWVHLTVGNAGTEDPINNKAEITVNSMIYPENEEFTGFVFPAPLASHIFIGGGADDALASVTAYFKDLRILREFKDRDAVYRSMHVFQMLQEPNLIAYYTFFQMATPMYFLDQTDTFRTLIEPIDSDNAPFIIAKTDTPKLCTAEQFYDSVSQSCRIYLYLDDFRDGILKSRSDSTVDLLLVCFFYLNLCEFF